MTAKVKLVGGLDKTVTWIWLDPAGGQLKIEYYKFSEPAQKFFGDDIAYTLSIPETEMKRLYSLTKQGENSRMDWASKTFGSYFEIKRWLDENRIESTREMESWA